MLFSLCTKYTDSVTATSTNDMSITTVTSVNDNNDDDDGYYTSSELQQVVKVDTYICTLFIL